MAANMLPIIALGAAALFLMKKKGGGTATGSTNGATNGNGNTGTNGANGKHLVVTESGTNHVKVGEPFEMEAPLGFAFGDTAAQFNGDPVNDEMLDKTTGFIEYSEKVTSYSAGNHSGQVLSSITLRILKPGKLQFGILLDYQQGGSANDLREFTFMVT